MKKTFFKLSIVLIFPILIFPVITVCNAESSTMRQYQLEKMGEADRLTPVVKTVLVPVPEANEVLIRVRATSLNHRDIYALYGRGRNPTGNVILSDGAGEVIAVGAKVDRFKAGDRVVATFQEQRPEVGGRRYGARNGMLAEVVVATEDTLLHIPEYLSYEEAATLPCAAVTAWNSLFTSANLKPDEYVLLEGTGGVSIFGLQFAIAAGARAIITSSSDDKLDKAKELGAFGTVNYVKNPDWQHDVLRITNGAGINHVLEVGGKDTLPKAVASLADGGHIALIGGLSEGGFVRETPHDLLKTRNASLTNIFVGTYKDFEDMLMFMNQHKLRPVIDKVFSFEDASAAFDHMESSAFFGKIVVSVN